MINLDETVPKIYKIRKQYDNSKRFGIKRGSYTHKPQYSEMKRYYPFKYNQEVAIDITL